MKLIDIVLRPPTPEPWMEHDNIPWYEPGFSERMLKEHLCQDHDAASRRKERIEKQTDWIHKELLGEKPTWILDLGCGPGLYTSQLARLGHTCSGIDFSPASIAYAEKTCLEQYLACSYQLADIRLAEYGVGYDMVMFIFGEPNVFCRENLRQILIKAFHALVPGGLLLLEPHTLAGVEKFGAHKKTWSINSSGLFSDRPHLLLEEGFWDPARQTATIRYDVLDASNAFLDCYGQSMQGYSNEQYTTLLEECGFSQVTFYPSMTGELDDTMPDLMAITARK